MSNLPKSPNKSAKRIFERLGVKRRGAPRVYYKAKEDGTYRVTIGEEDSIEEYVRLMEALGLFDSNMLMAFLSQVSNSVSTKNELVQTNIDFALGFVKSIEPLNEVEAALAAQMAATHVCMMDSSRRYLSADDDSLKESAERAMNRFGRAFTAQMDALKRYRQTAQQTVRVERVTVNEGGQAIVGNVELGGGHAGNKSCR